MTASPRTFRVALTGDFFAPDGSTKYPDIGLSTFEGQGHLEWVKLSEHRTPIGSDQLVGVQGVVVLTPAGRAMRDACIAAVGPLLPLAGRALDHAEMEQLLGLLRRLRVVLDAARGS